MGEVMSQGSQKTLHTVYDTDKLFYYFNSEDESNCIVLRLVLRRRVDKFILREALNQTLKRYPNFRQTPVLDAEGKLHTIENNREAEVYPYDPEPVTLGEKESNGFYFRVMYEGSTIWISAFHALCDGGGFMMFARTLLYYYAGLSGVPVSNEDGRILTQEVPVDPSELADPYKIDTGARPAPNALKTTGKEDIFLLPEKIKGTDECDHHVLFRFVLDTARLKNLAKEAGATVDTYMHLLIAGTIHDSYESGDSLIAGIGTVDVRPFYDSRYLQNLTDLFWIYYPKDIFTLPDRAACGIIQRLFKDQQLTRENIDGVRRESSRHFHEMFDFPMTSRQGLRMMREAFFNSPDLYVTYFMTNLVRLELGDDLDGLVAHADAYGPDIFKCPVLFLLTQGNETTVNITQRTMNRYFPLKMRETFIRKGLLIRDEMGLTFESDKIRVDEMPLVEE